MSKYTYYKVIQSDYGFGWEDVDYHETNSQYVFRTMKARAAFKENVEAYRVNAPQFPSRVINRRELNHEGI